MSFPLNALTPSNITALLLPYFQMTNLTFFCDFGLTDPDTDTTSSSESELLDLLELRPSTKSRTPPSFFFCDFGLTGPDTDTTSSSESELLELLALRPRVTVTACCGATKSRTLSSLCVLSLISLLRISAPCSRIMLPNVAERWHLMIYQK